MRKIVILFIALLVGINVSDAKCKVTVHPEGRFLMYEDGTPFFWLGDTAWQMFHRHTRESVRIYLQDRAMKGFNVIQGVCLAEHGGLSSPNAMGEWAFLDDLFQF